MGTTDSAAVASGTPVLAKKTIQPCVASPRLYFSTTLSASASTTAVLTMTPSRRQTMDRRTTRVPRVADEGGAAAAALAAAGAVAAGRRRRERRRRERRRRPGRRRRARRPALGGGGGGLVSADLRRESMYFALPDNTRDFFWAMRHRRAMPLPCCWPPARPAAGRARVERGVDDDGGGAAAPAPASSSTWSPRSRCSGTCAPDAFARCSSR